jgi:tellurite resistance protein TehA-like permease
MGIWRHVIRRFALRYDAGYWAMVFPLGMYTACTLRLSRALDLPMLRAISEAFIYVALGSWLVLFGAMVHHLARWLSGRGTATQKLSR